VDVPELTRVLVFEPWPGNKQEAEATAPGQWRYRTDAPEFELWRIDVQGTRAVLASDGPEVLILIDGEVTANKAAAPLQRGKGVFVPASDGSYELSGHGTVYRALVP
jgi:mannose-6-phosphate isomerase